MKFSAIKYLSLLISSFITTTCFGSFYYANQPFVEMHRLPNAKSERVSQALYGERVQMVKTQKNWNQIITTDGYKGWVKHNEIKALNDRYHPNTQVKNLFAHIYCDASTTQSPAILTVPYNTPLHVIGDRKKRWLKVDLINGKMGWIQSGDITDYHQKLSISEMLLNARRFIGLPYTWGGRTSYGYDCSGFVQTMYAKLGIQLARDASVQAKDPRLETVKRNQLKPGDLLFFGKKEITHVGIYLGNDQFINATTFKNPIIQINSLKKEYWKHLLLLARRIRGTG